MKVTKRVMTKNTTNPAKNGVRKNNFGHDGPWGDRPRDPFQMALRAALWTIGTSGKALHDCKRTTFDSYRNLVRRDGCTNNNKMCIANCTAVLL